MFYSKILIPAVALALFSASASAVTLVELDFSGSGGIGNIASTDSQFTTNSAVTFDDTATAFTAIGGSAGVGGWNYDGTGAAAANNDLFTSSNFGSTTRFDVDLGLAATGQTYTITSVEIDIRASNSAGTNWDFMYRDTNGVNQILSGGAITVQGGTAPRTTYSITIAGGLVATDSAVAWNTGNELRFAFYEANGTGADNLQIDAIRFIGTTIPEPSAYAMIAGMLALSWVATRRRK